MQPQNSSIKATILQNSDSASEAYEVTFNEYGKNYNSNQQEKEYPCGESYTPRSDYAIVIQNDSNYVFYRQRLYNWMLYFCEQMEYTHDIAYTAMNYVDRYLSCVKVSSNDLPTLSYCCFHLASLETDRKNMYTFKHLCHDTGINNEKEVRKYLMKILDVLKFRLNPTTPYDILYTILKYVDATSLFDAYSNELDKLCPNYDLLAFTPYEIVITVVPYFWYCYYHSQHPVLYELAKTVSRLTKKTIFNFICSYPQDMDALFIEIYDHKPTMNGESPFSVTSMYH
ncbi:hypothetical protein WA158_003225 [Blastocystis sp. Blastoise]